MSEPTEFTPPATPAKSDSSRPASSAKPASSKSKPAANVPAEGRRDFFSDAMRETLAPLAGLLERKINPILAALEAIPDDVDRLTGPSKAPRTLDQPTSAPYGPFEPLPGPDPPRYLRPPGAVPLDQFEKLCTGCAKCVEVCPAQAIRLDFYGIVADQRPYIIANEQPCVVCESLACMNQCPTHALRLVDRLKIQMGAARVILDRCVRENGEDCRACVEACPIRGPGAGPAGDAIIIHEPTGRVRVRRNACIGCGLCEKNCPPFPAAIVVDPYRPPTDPIIA
jgi:ferredoxin-type protein NapG